MRGLRRLRGVPSLRAPDSLASSTRRSIRCGWVSLLVLTGCAAWREAPDPGVFATKPAIGIEASSPLDDAIAVPRLRPEDVVAGRLEGAVVAAGTVSERADEARVADASSDESHDAGSRLDAERARAPGSVAKDRELARRAVTEGTRERNQASHRAPSDAAVRDRWPEGLGEPGEIRLYLRWITEGARSFARLSTTRYWASDSTRVLPVHAFPVRAAWLPVRVGSDGRTRTLHFDHGVPDVAALEAYLVHRAEALGDDEIAFGDGLRVSLLSDDAAPAAVVDLIIDVCRAVPGVRLERGVVPAVPAASPASAASSPASSAPRGPAGSDE